MTHEKKRNEFPFGYLVRKGFALIFLDQSNIFVTPIYKGLNSSLGMHQN